MVSENTDRDALARRLRTRPQSTDKRITLQERDRRWLRTLHQHGPLPSSYLLDFARDLGTSQKRAKERLTDLFNEANTAHGGPYLMRPLQQFRTIDSRYNQLVYDLAPAGVAALKSAGEWHELIARPSGPWLHAHFVACISASIELAARKDPELSFISGWRVLERAQASLRHPVTIKEMGGASSHADLIPDGLFGLEYRTPAGKRFRFFLIEADRATEPLTSRQSYRKSVWRSFAQYQMYIEGGAYRQHLALTAPLLVLNVVTSAQRLQAMQELLVERFPSAAPYQLFRSWEDFAGVWRPTDPRTDLLTEPWQRSGRSPLAIDRP
ncbi:MAG: replication-relaxation family protein [Azospirillaceae bacterium]